MRFNNLIPFNAVANSGTKVSSAIDTSQVFTGSFQSLFSDSAAAGTLSIQASNDPYELLPGGEAPQNWLDIANTSTSVASGASKLITIQTVNYRWVRVKWVSSGGSGTLTVTSFLQGY